MRLRSVQIGLPRVLGDPAKSGIFEREWTTAFYKENVAGAVRVHPEGLEGDGQADKTVHGGPDKAICVYPAAHFGDWEEELGLEISSGAFGENFTVEEAVETEVCIGDVFEVGTAVLQLSQPRQPCWKVARRWNRKDLTALVQSSGRTGWYFRVLGEGSVEAGDSLRLKERIHPEWSVARANEIMYRRKNDIPAARELAAMQELSQSWREMMENRIA